MIYPRLTADGCLVSDEQLVSAQEHLMVKHRIIALCGQISHEVEVGGGNLFNNALLALDSQSHEPIKIILSSPGGSLDGALLIYDTMKTLQSPIEILGRYAASAATLLLAGGAKRYLLPHTKVMLHLPEMGMRGDSREWDIYHSQMEEAKQSIADVLIECGVKKTREEIYHDIDRDLWFRPVEAIAYGLADEIMTKDKMAEWLGQTKPKTRVKKNG